MRAVLMGDVIAAARVLAPWPAPCRAKLLWRMTQEATRADAHRHRTGRMHPIWGDGSLMAAALRRSAPPEPWLDDDGYRAAIILVLDWIGRRPGAAGAAARSGGCRD